MNPSLLRIRQVVLSVCLTVVFGALSFAQEMPVVTKIEIKGLKRIEEGAVRPKISQKVNEPLSQDKVSDDIRSIFKMGYFDDVKTEIEPFEGGSKLIFVIKEKPSIVKLDFQGNKELDDAKLREKISITAGSIADTVLIQDNAAKLRKFYEEEGYWLANIVPVTKKLSENEITLTYQIDEGTKIKIKKISVEGNSKISASKIKGAMATKEWWLLSFITSSGYYKKEQMESDLEKIKALYFNNGFLKVVVAEPELTVDRSKQAMTILIRVSEGEQYRLSGIDITGNKIFSSDVLKKKITVKPGTVFNKSLLEKDLQSMSSVYSESGYAMASVVPDIAPDEKNRTVQVTLVITEGEKYRIGRIEVSGNTKTRDKVIRREIRFDEGETFDSSKLKRSYERINNLNFFETVDIVPKPSSETKTVDLEVKVKERPTGFLSVGGGYSSIDKLIGTVDLTQGNLWGTGRLVKLKGELGGKSSLYELSYRDPWFLDKPMALSAGIYKTKRDFIEYDKSAFGFYVGLGKSLSEYWNGDVSYNFERATISLPETKEECLANCDTSSLDYQGCVNLCSTITTITPSPIVLDQVGTKTTSSITTSVARDSRDNFLDPSRGSRNSLSLMYAGVGGDNYFFKGWADSAWYFPIGPTTVMFRGRFGYAKGLFNKEVPLYERFYVGGIYTVRGLGFGEAGPKDEKTGEPIGGTTELIFNSEYIFPLLPEMKLKGVVFFDMGNSYESFTNFGHMKYTTGAGIRWISPVGPIRVEWGYNLKRETGESSNKFEFAFGSFF